MPPLNPFLRAFFRSALPGQCSPIAHHVILCPTTDVLLNAKDRETGTQYADLAATEDFLASHVLRVPGGGPSGGKDGASAGSGGGSDGGGGIGSREAKGKARQYSTINGRTVVVKDTFVYSNKGFKTLNQAQLLQDIIYYPDVADGQQWLVYYISRPLIGLFLATPVLPAVISDEPSKERRKVLAEASGNASPTAGPSSIGGGKKKEVKSFGDLMLQFPMISRQMQSGLEKVIREFVAANDQPLPKKSSRRSSISSQASTPSLGESITSLKSSLSGGSQRTTVHPTSIELEPEEEIMRTSLETAITKAIELFQSVDKAQLSLLGASTALTGPVVEHMIERYVTEQVHDQTLFRRVCAIRKADDSDLESKIRRMADVDIAQVGIPIEDGMKGKRLLAARLTKGVEAFRKMGVASSPQEMLEILLLTQKVITEAASTPATEADVDREVQSEKTPTALTVNADILVSMLLIVVIRSGVRHLHSRLLYMRYFIFIDEVESGEQGYALATLEAVLAHLTNASSSLRKASKRNRALWQAAKCGDIQAVEAILQPSMIAPSEATVVESPKEALEYEDTSEDEESSLKDLEQEEIAVEGASRPPTQNGDFVAVNGSLEHVFPFERPPTPPPEQMQARGKKRVSMARLPRSGSTSSAYSSRSHSRHLSTDSTLSANLGGDLSTERLAQTQDADGNSVLMMAVEAGEAQALRFLLSMPAHFRADFVLDDVNSDGATLLNAAVQSGNRPVTDELIMYIEDHTSHEELRKYLAVQDGKGRCMAHYLFTQPHLIPRFGKKLPWRLKDRNGQTPLFALCRSYDHEEYHSMVEVALILGTETQGDNHPLHLDDHVDAKGNTLLHIVNDASIALKLLRQCDADVNAANDKRFTPLMVGSKYGRIDLVRALFGDPRVDMTLKDIRGLTAVELAKDDDVRNRIDDLVLLSTPPTGEDGRMTTVVRSFFVEDATIRFVLKSGGPNPNGTITVTTCRRTVGDFENLSKWLNIECPASWIPTHFNLPSPFLVPSKPSRAVLRDTQIRLDNFLRALLTHATFSTHELVWEFFLVPEIDEAMLSERSKRKAESRVDNIKDDYEPVTDTAEVASFVSFAREQMRGVLSSTRKLIRSTNRRRTTYNDFAESANLLSNRFKTLLFLPQPYLTAIDRYDRTLTPTEAGPFNTFYYTLHSIQSTVLAIQSALDRPAYLINNIASIQRNIDRNLTTAMRQTRWTPTGFFEDARKQVAAEAAEKAEKGGRELESLGCELRYTQQTVAGELAGWQEEHVRVGRLALRRLAKEMIVRERARLEGMRRALREVQKHKV